MWAELHIKLQDPITVLTPGIGISILGNSKNSPAKFPALRSSEEDTLDDSDYQYYITLEAAFDMINKYIIAKSDSGDQEPLITLSTKSSTYNLPPDSAPTDLLCVAHPLQISVDPSVCLIKNNVWTTNITSAAIPNYSVGTKPGKNTSDSSLKTKAISASAKGKKILLDPIFKRRLKQLSEAN